jgi:hypothetical protein
MNDRRILAAQFQRAGGQMLCCRLMHDLADGRTAGEEDEIPLLLEPCGRLRDGAIDHRDRPRIEVLGHQTRRRGGA